jgi:hypothetical protein
MWYWRRIEEISGADRVYMKKCYILRVLFAKDVSFFFFATFNMASVQLSECSFEPLRSLEGTKCVSYEVLECARSSENTSLGVNIRFLS